MLRASDCTIVSLLLINIFTLSLAQRNPCQYEILNDAVCTIHGSFGDSIIVPQRDNDFSVFDLSNIVNSFLLSIQSIPLLDITTSLISLEHTESLQVEQISPVEADVAEIERIEIDISQRFGFDMFSGEKFYQFHSHSYNRITLTGYTVDSILKVVLFKGECDNLTWMFVSSDFCGDSNVLEIDILPEQIYLIAIFGEQCDFIIDFELSEL